MKYEKIKTLEEIVDLAETFKKNGLIVVTTCGCFDILHYGHVQYLEEAKNYGDVLIVGINSDESVSKIKGKRRPLITEEERIGIVASLGCVNYVFVFNENDPSDWLKKIKPNVHAKGGDYSLNYTDCIEYKLQKKLNMKFIITKCYGVEKTTDTVKRILEVYDKLDDNYGK